MCHLISTQLNCLINRFSALKMLKFKAFFKLLAIDIFHLSQHNSTLQSLPLHATWPAKTVVFTHSNIQILYRTNSFDLLPNLGHQDTRTSTINNNNFHISRSFNCHSHLAITFGAALQRS